MSKFRGFADLRCAGDLVEKLKHDLDRIRAQPCDQYAAFDFFVTAEHVVDWLFPDDRMKRHDLRRHPLLAVTSHIANGAKHFHTRDGRHGSVANLRALHLIEPGYVEPGYYEIPLRVDLAPEYRGAFDGADSVDLTELAEAVLQFWRDYLSAGEAPTTS